MSAHDGAALQEHFDATHAAREDPWGVTSRWYEIRKRAVLLASLPSEHVSATLEVGCSIGVVTEALAERSDTVLAVDLSGRAVERARQRVTELPGVRVEQRNVVESFPEGMYDLIVLSEVGYYLEPAQLRALRLRMEGALRFGGSLVACHWRHPESDFLQSGDEVHAVLDASILLHRTVRHEEADFVLDVFSTDPRSVAEQARRR
jgi:protein-L-isoaspartate O-methyltransferase